jgi:hypothetical protein
VTAARLAWFFRRPACARPIRSAIASAALGIVLWGALTAGARAANWAPNLTTSATWDSNASQARSSSVQIDGLEIQADVLASESVALGPQDALHGTAHLNATWWPRFERLNTAAAGARGEWRHRFGPGPFASELGIGIGGDAIAARDPGRRGTSGALLFRFDKHLTDVARLTLRQAFTRDYARAEVYDGKAAQTTLELARELTDLARLVLGVDWRKGDLASHSQPRSDFDDVARTSAEVNTFRTPLIAYAVNARTISGRAAIIRALDAASALIVAYEYRDTSGGPVRFQNHRASLALVHQF